MVLLCFGATEEPSLGLVLVFLELCCLFVAVLLPTAPSGFLRYFYFFENFGEYEKSGGQILTMGKSHFHTTQRPTFFFPFEDFLFLGGLREGIAIGGLGGVERAGRIF